jgi:hypothetical protein
MIRFFVFNVCTFSCLLPAQSLDSFSAVQKAYETQPELQAALQQLKATQARSTQELRWSNPDLRIHLTDRGEVDKTASAVCRFPRPSRSEGAWPGKRTFPNWKSSSPQMKSTPSALRLRKAFAVRF